MKIRLDIDGSLRASRKKFLRVLYDRPKPIGPGEELSGVTLSLLPWVVI